eukprot:TRINITY_DN58675_c0_g1_i1.p1 TRINITY_DN58675_c0_g1~~TRINITY_DN58675_c0_g1_i1.p1  ORF type:complete len:1058 (-),score=173.50 TRINITY_DN58675_c0_g1_i1:88-2985(-)
MTETAAQQQCFQDLWGVGETIASIDAQELARSARKLHEECAALLSDLTKRAEKLTAKHDARFAPTSVQNAVQSVQSSFEKLSREQRDAVQCPTALFLQGRSGTGKTYVIVSRMLWRRKTSRINSQLFVTKSSLLRDVVAQQLVDAGISLAPMQFPPDGLLCCTWEQLVTLMIGRRKASVDFHCFLHKYWPVLEPSARGLCPQLVWIEFCTRLRPFGRALAQSLSSDEYLTDDISGLGIRLTGVEQKAVFTMFTHYRTLKARFGELDDIDVAAAVQRQASHASRSVEEVYIDEAQDFAPAELTVLMAFHRNRDGLTVAGDTCQTINPGSAFSFQDIVGAFYKQGGETLSSLTAHRVHHLHYNYRCAPGVAALASNVAETLLSRFPHSADHIHEETVAQLAATVPIFLEMPGHRPASFIMGTGEHCIAGIDASKSAILVRNDLARKRLRDDGVWGTVLTVSEAKGLEFDLVLACGFLGDCPHGQTVWALADHTSQQAKKAADLRVDPFSRSNHVQVALSIQEFKMLYVAITRARAGFVILEVDTNPSVWSPLISEWERSNIIERWTGASQYLFQTDPEQAQLETVHVTTNKQDMLSLLRSELLHRTGQCHKAARKALNRELQRLRIGQPDPAFLHAFEAEYGNLFAECSETLTHRESQTSLRSVMPLVSSRFGVAASADLSTTAHELRVRGRQLLSHGIDNPRDRWQIFAESRQVLHQCQHVLDAMLMAQVRNRGRKQAPPPDSLEMWILPDENIVWHLQVAAVLQEACRTSSWRGGSTLSLLRRLHLWEEIFAFIAPVDEKDVRNSVRLISERIYEHASLRQDVMSSRALAGAHGWFNKACYGSSAQAEEHTVAEQCSSAGRAFLSFRFYHLAAESFSQAANILQHATKREITARFALLESQLASFRFKSGCCWLLRGFASTKSRQESLSFAGGEFGHGSWFEESLTCWWANASDKPPLDRRLSCP